MQFRIAAPYFPTIPALCNRLRPVAHLVIHTPDRGWEELPLADQEQWTIGRDPGSDIFINHQKVSRQHARLERRGSRFIIRDPMRLKLELSR